MKKHDFLLLSIYIYLALPILLFVALWLKPIYAIIGSILLIFGIYISYKSDSHLWRPELNKKNISIIVLFIFISCLLIITSGVGASVVQYPDHLYRNQIFRILIDKDWPALLTINGTTKLLSYYIGYWLPAALIAKFTSYQFGFLFLQIWGVIGLFFVFYLICEKRQKIKLWYILVFIFFGGADAIGFKLIGELFNQLGNKYEWWAVIYNYPGLITSLFWSYNQVLYAWIVHLMIMRQNNNKNIVLIWSTSLINCTFPAVGMIPFAIYKAISNIEEKQFIKRFIKAITSSITPQFVIGVIISLISTLYLMSNINIVNNMAISDITNNTISISKTLSSDGATVVDFSSYDWTLQLYSYLWFVLIEFGLYFIVLFKSQSNKSIYWFTLIVLLVCPLIEIGGWIDFCMRGSIPALICLFDMTIDALEDYYLNKDKLYVYLIIGLLIISGRSLFDTFVGVMNPTANALYNGESINADAFPEQYVFNADNFFSYDNTFFFKNLAK